MLLTIGNRNGLAQSCLLSFIRVRHHATGWKRDQCTDLLQI
jgi:hypothetical protein